MSRKKNPEVIIEEYINQGQCSALKEYLSSLPVGKALEVCSYEIPYKGTSLHLAAKYGHLDIVQSLIGDIGVNVNISLSEGLQVSGQTALHEACLEGHSSIVQYLLAKGADANAREQDGQTPLHCVCQSQSVDILMLLLDNGADINIADNRKQTPLQRSMLRSSVNFTQYLIENGADVHVLDGDGQTLLHDAVEWENTELIEKFIEVGLSVNAQDNSGKSPLHLATGNPEIMRLLLDKGADASIRDNRGKPGIEQQLDMQKKEYQAINNTLCKKKPEQQSKPENTDAAVKIQQKIKLGVAGNKEVKIAKSGVMAELLAKSKRTDKHPV